MRFAYKYVTESRDLPTIAQEIASAAILSEDLETTGFSPITCEIRLWSINTGRNIYVIDVFKTGRPDCIIQAHKDNQKAVVVGTNLKFDQSFLLYHYGLELGPLFDCFRASNLLWNGRNLGHNLYDLYRRELKVEPEAKDLGGSDWSAPTLTQDQLDYAAEDVYYLPMLRDSLKPQLAKMNLNQVARIEFQAILAEAAVELSGFYLNPKAWREVSAQNLVKHDTMQEVLWNELPDPDNQMTLPGLQARWNLDSPKQMLASLRRLGVTQMIKNPVTYRDERKTIQDTSEITLVMALDAHPILSKVIEYREAATQIKMFGPEFLNFTNPVTHRLHPGYFPFLVSGRYACSRPNLSQIPRDKRFRKCFQAEEGNTLCIADYCLVPGTRVLKTDLSWVPVETLKPKDEVIGFDEKLKGRETKFRRAKVTATKFLRRPCFRVVTTRGAVTASDLHGWVAKKRSSKCSRVREWVVTKDLEPGDEIAYIGDPWEEDLSRDAGYLAGVFDGEGWVQTAGARLGFGQKPGAVWDRTEKLLTEKGYDFGSKFDRKRDMKQLWLRGEAAALRFMGEIRPSRLLEKAALVWEGRSTWGRRTAPAVVLSVEPVGEQEVVAVQTSTGTLIAEGMLSHNSNIEMCIVAEISGDEVLTNVFREKKDAHRFTASIMTGKAEKDVAKAERQQAKPVNFGLCIAEGQRVLTQVGLVPIERVEGWHKVWDGVEWVSHDGVIFMGNKKVMTWDGLTATPDHEVYTDAGTRIRLEDAASPLCSRRLAIGALGEVPVGYTAFDRKSRESGAESALRRGEVPSVQDVSMASGGQREGGQEHQLHVPGEVQGSSSTYFGRSLRRYGAALSSRYARLVNAVQGAWHQSTFSFQGALCTVGASDISNFGLQGVGFRPDEQRRALQPAQSAASDSLGESPKQVKVYDLLNAGPRHRFTVEGKVVSNCYGMQPPKLVLYARAGYGVTMSLKEATVYRERYFEKFAGIAKWHLMAQRNGQRQKMAWSIAGRLRYLDTGEFFNEYYNCVDAETEALTDRGWVRGFDLNKSDKLLTKNLNTGLLEWQLPTEIKLWPNYHGPLTEFSSRSFSAVSTPKHRWPIFDAHSKTNKCVTTESLHKHGGHRIHRTGSYLKATSQYSDDFVRLCGWFLTDGCYLELPRKKTKPKPEARLFQSLRANKHKVAKIDALVGRLSVKKYRYVWKKEGRVTWHLTTKVSKQLHKLFPSRVLTSGFMCGISGVQAKLLLETMLLGDGTVDASGKRSFCSGSMAAASMFQFLAVLCGQAATIRKVDASKRKPAKSDKMPNIPKSGISYTVNLLKRDKVQVTKKQSRDFVATTPVWCPIVPNTFFVARRQGHVFITGNTPVQATGADGLKSALRCVYNRFKKLIGRPPTRIKDLPEPTVKMVHHVHDEIVSEAKDDKDFIEAVKHEQEEGMKEGMQPLLKNVPVSVEASSGYTWADKA